MNRMGDVLLRPDLSLPHTRGDEPQTSHWLAKASSVCPTRVGMNRGDALGRGTGPSVCPTHAWG